MTPAEFDSAIRAYCAATDASETSGRRTPKHNAAVGGVPNSAHLLGTGKDVVYDDPDTPERVAYREALARRVGLRLIHEGDHDHIQPA